ncbi:MULTISPECIES: dihydroneopterin aldolase [Paenibacillus]|uniref:7,8-dihydroneopterin aldolase n=1 Tax=Paenibacillus oceani TaxID=2772510 RepID=A0A927H2B3_9BACL|nr:dihydroneopterin aldolase [Paenibacillus oceani]MBD2866071.1 dihydroneopterin aldolase [Paenibacillus oceani]
MDTMRLSRMQFYGYHGVFPEENKLGQRFYVDLELSLDLSKAGQTDDLEQTVNYAEVYERVKRIVEGKPFRLIEALAENVASDVLHQYTSVNDVTVRVVKPHPPFDIHFDGVTVEINRKRASI